MNHRDPSPLRGPLLVLLLICLWVFAAYGFFVGGVCIWVGCGHVHQPGYWVPILAGGLTIGSVLGLTLPAEKAIRNAIRRNGGEGAIGPY